MESKNDKAQNIENNDDDKSFYLRKNTQLEIYDIRGNKLNISVCENKIKIMKYLGDVNQLDFNLSRVFQNKVQIYLMQIMIILMISVINMIIYMVKILY